MDKSIVPEILRSPLERLVLASKLLEITDPPKAILALALDPPDLSNIESTIWKLKEVPFVVLNIQCVMYVFISVRRLINYLPRS